MLNRRWAGRPCRGGEALRDAVHWALLPPIHWQNRRDAQAQVLPGLVQSSAPASGARSHRSQAVLMRSLDLRVAA